ncbi:MAG: PAS domain S-box protein [Dehalococcoidales bacterium]|nr:PAS domain S-box protein [Dehalococcoidales bacterium]
MAIKDITERKKAENKLADSGVRYRRLFETAPDAILILNGDTGRIIDANPFIKDLLGFSIDELVGKNLWKISEFKNTLANKISYQELSGSCYKRWDNLPLVTKDGRQILVEVVANGYQVDHTRIIQCNIRDMTIANLATQALNEINQDLKVAQRLTKIGNWKWIIATNKVTWSEELCRMNGWETNLPVPPFAEMGRFYTPESWKRLNDLVTNAFNTGESYKCELNQIRTDGIMITTFCRGEAVRDASGKIVSLHGTVQDITERKRSEDQLRIAEQNFRNSLDDSPLGIRIITANGELLYANKAILDIYGYSSVEKLRTIPVKERYTPKSYAEHQKRKELRKLGKPVPSNYEISIVREDREIKHLLVSRKEVFWNSKLQFQSVYQDITERKQMEMKLMAQDRLASIGQLVSGVAHEINNPLTGVIGFSELLLKRDLPDDVKADLKVVNDEAMRTAKIVKNLLAFARKQPEGKAPVDINEQIQRVLDLRDHEQKVNNINVNTRFASDLPQIMGNGSQLQQVFFNIVINAEFFMLEAHQKGNLTITTKRIRDFLRCSLADDGPGISEKNMKNLFIPFFTTKEVGKGTGLGLSICYGIITEHGGRIYAESTPKKGATFVVELPIKEETTSQVLR